MWTYECSAETPAAPDAVWRRYADVAGWPSWNGAVERVRLDGPFAAGTTGELTPPGQEPLPLRITAAIENVGYTSETAIADTVTLRLTSTLTALPGGGTRITHRADLVGPAAEHFGQSFGPALTAGLPRSIQALASLAADLPTAPAEEVR